MTHILSIHDRLPELLKHGALFAVAALLAGTVAACGTDFTEPPRVGARPETPDPQPTVFQVIEVTPQPSPTPLPTPEGPDGAAQRPFPSEIDPSRAGAGLPDDAVMGFWREYLTDTRVIVEGKLVDVHLCADGSLVPGSPSTFINAGTWALRPSNGEWYEVVLGREFRAGRISGFAQLSRIGGTTVDRNDGISVVSVTDSDFCADTGGL